jgi:hypothetical protein
VVLSKMDEMVSLSEQDICSHLLHAEVRPKGRVGSGSSAIRGWPHRQFDCAPGFDASPARNSDVDSLIEPTRCTPARRPEFRAAARAYWLRR